jgi:hypothetical protein
LAGADLRDRGRAGARGASAQAQALQTLCAQAQAQGADGGCRIVSSAQAASGKPRARVADRANISVNTSGLYYDPSRSGEGVLLEILPDNTALAAWFTFRATATAASRSG